MVRSGTPVRVQAALSPNTGDEAVADQGGVGWPFGMLREYPFLGADAVDQRCPTDQYEKECDRIPFLQVVPDVCKYVREVHRVAEEPVGPISYQTSQSWTDPEESSHGEQTNETKTGREHHQHQASCGRCYLPGRPAQIDDLRIRINVSDADRDARTNGVIPHFRGRPCNGDPKHDQMLQNIDPICDREGGRE